MGIVIEAQGVRSLIHIRLGRPVFKLSGAR
jgi:hypothetical protein